MTRWSLTTLILAAGCEPQPLNPIGGDDDDDSTVVDTDVVDTDDTVVDTDDTDVTDPGGVLSAPETHYGIANWDNGPPDWMLGADPTDDDLGTLEIVPSGTAADALYIEVDVPAEVRIYHDGAVVIDRDRSSVELPWQSDPVELLVEFGDHDVDVMMTIEELDSNGDPLQTAETRLRSGPMLLLNHLMESEKVVSVSVNSLFYDNQLMMQQYEDALGTAMFERIAGSAYGSDVWVQDEMQFAWSTTPDGDRMNVIIDSIRDRGLDPYPENEWRGEDFGVLTWGTGNATSLDSFGNLETSPPVDGYPLGRIYYGGTPGYSPNDTVLFDYLELQSLQDPFMVDSTWLCVGHVDEIMSFIPDPSAPRGFRFVFTDTQAAWDVLDAMPSGTSIPRWSGNQNHGYSTVGQIVADNGLRNLNDDIQADHLDPILDQMKTELGLLDEEIILMPGIFEEAAFCGPYVAALIPGMANLIVVNEPGGDTKVFMADPFLRTDLNDQASDPMIAAVNAVFPSTVQTYFLDDWETYHLALGEVHCGTNMTRTPDLDWWNYDMGGN